MNNPVGFVDGNGYIVVAKQVEVQTAILDGFTEEEQAFIQFNEDGSINEDIMTNNPNPSDKFKELQTVVEDEETLEIFISEDNKLMTSYPSGEIKEWKFPALPETNNCDGQLYSLSSGRCGFMGFFQVPLHHKNEDFSSVNENTRVFMRSGLSRVEYAELLSHEFLHAYFGFMKKNGNRKYDEEHRWNKHKTYDLNNKLRRRIHKRVEETKKNMKANGVK